MKKILKTATVIGSALPFLAFAQTTFRSILGTIGNLINTLIPILIAAALAWFIYGVIKFITSKDGDGKKEARGIVINGIIGLFIIVSVWGLIGVIQTSFGVGTGGNLDSSQIPGVNLNNSF